MAFGDFTVVRSTPKRVTNSSGVLAEVAINTPAFEFNTDGTYKGLLVEPAATNLVTYSAQLDDAAWLKTATTITANATTSPDGGTNAEKFTPTVASSEHFIESNLVAFTSGVVYTFSFYAKKSERDFIQFTASSALLAIRANYNINTGVLGTVDSGITASITNAGNGWFRCSATFTATATGSFRAIISAITASTSARFQSFAGDGTSGLFLWGAQLETGAVATSYIPTVASTANRTADSVTLTGASSLIGQSAGTVFVEAEPRIIDGTRRFVSISDGTTQNRIIVTLHDTTRPRMIVTNGNVSQADILPVGSLSGIVKIAIVYALNDFALYANGSSLGTDTSGTVPPTNRIRLGLAEVADEFYFNGWIRSVALFPTRLTNDQLESLTTL